MATHPDKAAAQAAEFDLDLPSGRFHAERFGSPDDPLVLCVPGLSANLKGFDFIGERIVGDGLQVVAIDLRGRGRSDVTAPGTYGWLAHARDLLDAARALGADRFSVIGQSMGGYVAMQAAALDAARIERIVLVDVCSTPDPGVVPPIVASVERLGSVYLSFDTYLELVRGLGTIVPWSEYWERYFRYDLEPVEGGVRARSNRDAVLEDLRYGGEHTAYEFWPHLTMPVLLLRASKELLPGSGYIVPAAERDRFLREVAAARAVEVDANHYGINTHPDSVAAIRDFFQTTRR